MCNGLRSVEIMKKISVSFPPQKHYCQELNAEKVNLVQKLWGTFNGTLGRRADCSISVSVA